MPLDHQCQPRHGVSYACEYLPHNDGQTANPVTAWQAWCATALGAGDVMELCKGDWLFPEEVVLTAPSGTGGMVFRGLGSGKSRIIGGGSSGAVLRIPRAGASRFEGFAVWAQGSPEHGIRWGGEGFAANHSYDVHALGAWRDGAYYVDESSDCTWTAYRAHTWRNDPQVPLSPPGIAAAVRLNNCRNHVLRSGERHCFIPSGSGMVATGDVNAITFDDRVGSVSVRPGTPWGMAHLYFSQRARGIVVLNEVLEAEPITVPGSNPPVTESHAPTFALYFNGGVDGLHVVGGELYFHHAVLSGGPDVTFNNVRLHSQYMNVPAAPGNAWIFKTAPGSNPAAPTLTNSDIYCGGLPLKPGASIDKWTILRDPGPITWWAHGSQDYRLVK